MLIQKIKQDLVSHIKSGDKIKISITRLLIAALKDKEISLRNNQDFDELINDNIVMEIINKMIKQRNDSIAQFTSGGRSDLAEKEQLEVNVLSKYKPEQLDESQISEKVSSAIVESGATSMQDMGKVMGVLKNLIPAGTADMALVSKIVKDNLS